MRLCSAVLGFLAKEYGTVSALNSAWNVSASSWSDVPRASKEKGLNESAFDADSERWVEVASRRYFSVCSRAIRKVDKNHLLFGMRSVGLTAAEMRGMLDEEGKPLVDLVDIHGYGTVPPGQYELAHSITGLPVLSGEFSFTAVDANTPNTKGARAGFAFATQTQRADAFLTYASAVAKTPYSLGWWWWELQDEPSSGRYPDGENSNYGVMALSDDPYQVLTETMTQFNQQADAIHAASYHATLHQFYSTSRKDHFLTITDCFECEGEYKPVDNLNSSIPTVPSPSSPTPLLLFYNLIANDNCVSTTMPTQPLYSQVRTVGFIAPNRTKTATTPLNLFYSSTLQDHWTTVGSEEKLAKEANYTLVKLLGYV